jgi:poly-beta-1,6-N-acetyl-D-glucosamine synthase
MPEPRFLLISPVFNEAAHIQRVVRAVAAQEAPPTRWIVVDDGSTDGTLDLLLEMEPEVTFLEVLRREVTAEDELEDRLAVALEARAFNRGLRHAGGPADFDLIGKLDGDVELPPEWFRTLVDRLNDDASLGIVGATLEEPRGGRVERLKIPEHHVHGAVKLYRSECFEAIGGMQERLAWDTIDEVTARMRGYQTRTFRDLVALHLRPAATADGVLRGRARHGECAWILHYPLWWVVLRALKAGLSRPRLISGAWYLWGFVRSSLRRVPRVEEPGFRAFARAELRARARTAARLGGSELRPGAAHGP